MIKAVSFSLFGSAPIYLQGALRNAEQYPKFFPGWQCIFWCECESIPLDFMKQLTDRGAFVLPYRRKVFPNGMFARFCINDILKLERFIVRDVDSRPSQRERNAVQAWEDSGKSLHILRDHPWHCSLLMGGLWGAKAGVLKNVEALIKSFPRARMPYARENTYGADQDFLVHYLWPVAKHDALIHDSFCRHNMTGEPFPDGLTEGDFVGSIYDENEKPNIEHLEIRNQWIRKSGKMGSARGSDPTLDH